MAKQRIYECFNKLTKKVEATFCIMSDAQIYCLDHPSCDWRTVEFDIYVGVQK